MAKATLGNVTHFERHPASTENRMNVRRILLALALPLGRLVAQTPAKWPPDSLVNVSFFAKSTPVSQVWGAMRNISAALGVECTFCHVGPAGAELRQIDFPNDQKRNKLVARQMLRMVQEVNRRIDSIPERPTPPVAVSCLTCHRGVSRPVPLANIIMEVATTSGADSALRAYRALRQRYYGSDAYDFGEFSLNAAAFRTARAGKTDDALALLRYNEQLYPNTASLSIFRGNVYLMRADTNAADAAFREAIRRDPKNDEARGRLRDIGRSP
jgi:hypothetical protein